jgi:catechol 2,3-dioxygenase
VKPIDQPLAARLHHIGLASPNPDALASFYKSAMGLTLSQTSEGILGQAIGRKLFFVQGAPNTLQFAAFAVEDENNLLALRDRMVKADWKHVRLEDNSVLFAAGAIALDDPDGNHLIFGMPHVKDTRHGDAMRARLQHIVVASRDAARLSEFYQTVLGFSLSDIVVDEQHNLKTAFLRCSEEHHSFAVFQASIDRLDHHCYEVGDWALIRDWGDHFAALEIRIEWGPGRHGPGNNLFLFIHDIDGNWLEISAELEVVGADRPVGEWPHAQRTLNSWGTAPLRT